MLMFGTYEFKVHNVYETENNLIHSLLLLVNEEQAFSFKKIDKGISFKIDQSNLPINEEDMKHVTQNGP